MQQVVAVTAKERYVICVRFADGVEGTIDLSPLIGHGVFAQLADQEHFRAGPCRSDNPHGRMAAGDRFVPGYAV